MSASLVFLLVDDQEDNRYLLAKTLGRKFPLCRCVESANSKEAATILSRDSIAAVIVHRAADVDGLPLIEKLRPLTTRPIVAVSGRYTEEQARAAGADAVLHYDAWLRIGTVVEAALNKFKVAPGG